MHRAVVGFVINDFQRGLHMFRIRAYEGCDLSRHAPGGFGGLFWHHPERHRSFGSPKGTRARVTDEALTCQYPGCSSVLEINSSSKVVSVGGHEVTVRYSIVPPQAIRHVQPPPIRPGLPSQPDQITLDGVIAGEAYVPINGRLYSFGFSAQRIDCASHCWVNGGWNDTQVSSAALATYQKETSALLDQQRSLFEQVLATRPIWLAMPQDRPMAPNEARRNPADER